MESCSTNCRLCLTSQATNIINIFDAANVNKNIAWVIAKHFWFEIKEDDINKSICAACWSKVDDFHEYYNLVCNLHNDFYSKVQKIVKIEIEEESNLSACHSNNSDVLEDNPLELKLKLENDNSEKKTVNSSSKITDDELSEGNCSVDESEVIVDRTLINSVSEGDNKYEKSVNSSNSEKNSLKISSKVQRDEENKQIEEYLSMECEQCSIRCDSFTNIKLHYRKEHKMIGYLRCCNRKFIRRASLVEHIKRHLHPDIFKCDICNKNYANKRGLLEHHKWHLSSEKTPFKCTKCPKAYTKRYILEKHILTTHKNEKKIICDDCGKSYATKTLMQAHKNNIHGGANIRICDVCAKEFRGTTAFEIHQKTVHQNIILPKVQCQICGLWLKKVSLRKHMILHEDSKVNHFCSICGKKSLNRKALHKHITTVHSDKVYKCVMCEKTFKKQISLKEHMATHTGDTLYSCPHCPKTFNSSANMYSHKKKIHVKEWEEHERLKATGVL